MAFSLLSLTWLQPGNYQPQWLTDGRTVVYRPYVSLEGCLLGNFDMPELAVRAP